MKVTSQMRSLDLPDADLLAGEDLTQIHLPPLVSRSGRSW